MIVDVVIPARDEAAAIGKVLADIQDPRIRRVVVVDNGSRDATAQVARAAGATVVLEPTAGYGRACLRGLALLREAPPDVVAFLDGDYSDYPQDLTLLLDALAAGADLVIGSRALGGAARGSLTPVQVFGNWLATRLISVFFGEHFTDLGPMRVVRWEALERIGMIDQDFGWTVEMQVKAAQLRLRCAEVRVRYRPRIGTSKVSGTVRGSYLAGRKILWTIAHAAWVDARQRRRTR